MNGQKGLKAVTDSNLTVAHCQKLHLKIKPDIPKILSPPLQIALKRVKVNKNSSHTIDPDNIKIKSEKVESSGKTISYNQNDLHKLEVSIQKLRENLRASDSIKNSKTIK